MAELYPQAGATGEPGVAEAWFALHVRSRHEKLVDRFLREKGFECFLPSYRSRRRWCDRVKEVELPLFATYLFCRFNPSRMLPILTTQGVIRVVGAGNKPLPVADAEIAAIRAIVESRLNVEPWPYARVGQRVLLRYGPLRGLEGELLALKGERRLIVSVTLLQRCCAVEIDEAWAVPVDRSDAARIAESPVARLGERTRSQDRRSAALAR